MGKHKHSKDRMFITYSEHKTDWGGKKDPQHVPIAKLPFFCCGLSLMPFQDPVCSQDGVIFDIVNIIPFIKKYKKNPVTGQPLKITELIKLNFFKNDKNEFHDPISFKVFTEFTKIVAIKPSGNVFCYNTIEELNKKPKYFRDLLTDEPFTFRDLIILQDPTNLDKRTVKDFYHIKDNLQININSQISQDELINQSQTAKTILNQYDIKQKEKIEEAIKKKVKIEDPDPDSTNSWVKERLQKQDLQHSLYTINQVSTSVTCSAMDVHRDNKLRSLNELEIRALYYSEIKKQQQKGYVSIVTNLGSITLLLHCDFIPITCENFLELCEKKYYNNTKFHRLIKDFCLQGGDPTGTGSGGESIYGKEFQNEFHPQLSHNKPGMVSMANKGKDTNTSQFFFTLNECSHLDLKHTVFGEVIKGMNILEFINEMEVDKKDHPINEIVIKSTDIIENPYRQFVRKFRQLQKEILSEKPKDNQTISEKNTQDILKNVFKKEEIKNQSLAQELLNDF